LVSVIGCKVGIRPKKEDDWIEVANLWGMLVARPGFMKTPAASQVMAPVHHLERISAENYGALQREYAFEKEIYKSKRDAAVKKGNRPTEQEPEEPVWRRYFTNDSSYEKLCEILRDNPSGILLHRDELVSLLRHLDLEQNSQARGFYLAAWGGKDPYNSDRIGREPFTSSAHAYRCSARRSPV
jgi:hypothetical protein